MPAAARRARGFTLIDALVTCALVGACATFAVPSYQSSLRQARRADAVSALTKLEFAQGQFRANNGVYSADLNALGQRTGASQDGHYRISVHLLGADGFEASAVPTESSPQQHDGECATLTLQVRAERVLRGPSARCWLR